MQKEHLLKQSTPIHQPPLSIRQHFIQKSHKGDREREAALWSASTIQKSVLSNIDTNSMINQLARNATQTLSTEASQDTYHT